MLKSLTKITEVTASVINNLMQGHRLGLGCLRSSTAGGQGFLVGSQLITGQQRVLAAMNANRTQGCTASDYCPLPSTGEATPGTLHSAWGP